MPLSARARVELYLPDRPEPIYQDLYHAIVNEFTNVFGGCTTQHSKGSYLADSGASIAEKVLVVYADTEFDFQDNLELVTEYADHLRGDVHLALDEEEEILVAVWSVSHSV